MRRGTTPTLTFTVPFDTADIDKLYLTFEQKHMELEKAKDDCTFEEHKVIVTLSQEETLKFSEKEAVSIQMRVKFVGGGVDASNIIRTEFKHILKEGVI